MNIPSDGYQASELRVGVVIPVYNMGRPAGDAARSAQSALRGIQNIIVVYDGNADRITLRTLKALQRHGFHARHQKNGDVSAERNAGIRDLRTPYIVALDSDDEMLPRAPSAMADILDRHPDVATITGEGIEVTREEERFAHPADRKVMRVEMRDFSPLATAPLPTPFVGGDRRAPRRPCHR